MKPLNFLLINADQLRYDCLSFMGLRGVRTPNLDRLAARSVRYTRAFTPLPVCAPARQALLCGRHPDRFGAQWNYDFMPTPTVQPQWCWSTVLPEAGYQTAYLGRFHLSPDKKPQDFGYGKWISWADHKSLIAGKYPDLSWSGGWLGCPSPIDVEDSGTHWMARQACGVLEEFCASGKPWHLWVDYEEPHLPCRPSEPYATMYDPAAIPPWPGFGDSFRNKPYCHRQQTFSWDTDRLGWDDFAPMVARYYGVVSQLDEAIGRILDKLDKLGQTEQTVIVFTSDHGDMCGSHQMLDKHYVLYDDILRVPLLVSHPYFAPRTSSAMVMNCLDIPASIPGWFGIQPREPLTDGTALELSEEKHPRSEVVCTSNGQQFGLYTTRCLRTDRWKYVWNLTDVDELYDLDEDPGEKHNLIGLPEQSTRIADMRHRLYTNLTGHGDPFAGNEWMKRQLLEGKKHLPDTYDLQEATP